MKDYVITEKEGYEVFSESWKIKKVWKKVETETGLVWLYPVNVPNPGDFIHVWNPAENRNRPSFQGYGGSTLTFELEDGTMFKCIGPWHSNSEALERSTGINLRDKHMTFVVISHERTSEKGTYRSVMKDVIYMDTEPTIGAFERGKEMAQTLANELDKEVYLYSKSSGGSSNGPVYPEKKE